MTGMAGTQRPQSDLAVSPHGELEISTKLVRGFLGVTENELIELTAFVNGRPWVCHCVGIDGHIEALRKAESIRGFGGSYMLVNGPLDSRLGYRYERGVWQPANNKRATDRDVEMRRAVFIDVDPVRPSGISATDDENRAAREVADAVRQWLTDQIGQTPIGFGCSGNGFYILVALRPEPDPNASTLAVARFLRALGRKFGTERVKIDSSVSNPARLMSAPGTWKCKGISAPERPHRLTSFTCSGSVTRVRLGDLT